MVFSSTSAAQTCLRPNPCVVTRQRTIEDTRSSIYHYKTEKANVFPLLDVDTDAKPSLGRHCISLS